jgi:hypothetical protein
MMLVLPQEAEIRHLGIRCVASKTIDLLGYFRQRRRIFFEKRHIVKKDHKTGK